ncbi:hypothetical protein E3A20_09580 [Planctomyces bekefii]|uniref:Haem-binding uptake Tiki superfamily ChaN domain-containing protein n=1 Tax=Planctomyces bekefii TaxID=1653850 RepID=A0A5C6MAI2_9PLAN|nr:hypothetical protein E3A20_09580 [Planctomyces bekefii]
MRLMRSYKERYKGQQFLIALEMFKAVDQDSIDAYLAGNLPESEFLEAVNYQQEWGFPWQNFRMILDFAKTHKLPVIGINTENSGRDTLKERDRYAAECLVRAAVQYPNHKIMCLIGEYHLADGHLPKYLQLEMRRQKVKGKTLRLLNNIDDFYFKLQKDSALNSTEYLRLKKDFYCVMNSPPWMKWQSFSIWEDMRHVGSGQVNDSEGELDSDLDLQSEDAFDIDYQFLHFARNLADFLGLAIDSSDMESFHLQYSPDADFYKDLTQDLALTSKQAEQIIQRASQDGVYFLAKSNSVLLTYISINNLAESAGQYLYRVLTNFDDLLTTPNDDFNRRILKAAIGMIASKILNPRRKCMELHHFRQIVKRHKGQRLTGQAGSRRKIAQGVLAFDSWWHDLPDGLSPRSRKVLLRAVPVPPKELLRLDRNSNYELSRAIGQMLGLSLYKKVIANKEPPARLRRLFKSKSHTERAAWDQVEGLYRLMSR